MVLCLDIPKPVLCVLSLRLVKPKIYDDLSMSSDCSIQ